MHRVCFTGHRPEKLKQTESVIVKALEAAIKEAISDGKNVFISGMARGVDIWAAEIVLRLRKEGANVKLICASPYEGFKRGWSAEWQRRYNVILAAADLVRFICPGYSRACFQIRNEWMVDHSSLVIAVFNGQPTAPRTRLIMPSGRASVLEYTLRNMKIFFMNLRIILFFSGIGDIIILN